MEIIKSSNLATSALEKSLTHFNQDLILSWRMDEEKLFGIS